MNTPKQFWIMMVPVFLTTLLMAVTSKVLPGFVLFAWTPVWAAYALWQHLLRRQSTKLPPASQFDQEFRDLLEKEGKK